MNLAAKEQQVAELQGAITSSQAAILVGFEGCSCAELTGLRRQLRPLGGKLKIVKNTLAKRAVEGGDASALAEHLVGQTALVWSNEDPVSPAKLVTEFAKSKESFVVKGGVVDGAVVSKAEVEALASLPSKEELLAKLLALLNAPATRLLQTMNAPASSLVRCLEAVRAKKEAE